MKIHMNIALLATALLFLATSLTHGQGTIIVQHSGAADPTTEAFSSNIGGGESVGPVTNDLGINAWTTAISSGGSTLSYAYYLTPAEQTADIGSSWDLSITLRVVQGSGTVGNMFAVFDTGSQYFTLLFGLKANGDPFVRAGSSAQSPVFVLNGAGSTYNNYQLVYNSTSDLANLWINDIEEIDNITGGQSAQASGLFWGIVQPSGVPLQANWNLVSLEITPEPSTTSLILLGSGVLIYVRKRNYRSVQAKLD